MCGWTLPLSLIASVVGLLLVVDTESSLPPINPSTTASTVVEEQERSEARDSSSRNKVHPVDTCQASMTETTKVVKYEQDGAEAREIAAYLPYFPFKGIDRFYDIGGFLYEPAVFQRIVNIFADRYREIGIDVVAGYVYCARMDQNSPLNLAYGAICHAFSNVSYPYFDTVAFLWLLYPLQIGRSRVYFGSSHCIGASKAVCHDAQTGQNAQYYII
jgi:hypothetical protein